MSEIIGIVPGAGRASRIGGFFKELTPINVSPVDPSRFVVTSERIITQMKSGGASPIYFVVNSEKGMISEYFNKGSLFPSTSLYFTSQGNTESLYGMPFAIDKIYEEARGKTVFLGMPDNLIEPDNTFEILYNNFRNHKSDLELGLFATQPGVYGGYVEFDSRTNRVSNHIDKTAPNFPAARAKNSWAVACWNGRFTEFMHKFIQDKQDEYKYYGFGPMKELLFGDIIDAAIAQGEILVKADYISKTDGFYLDITEPEKYFQAVLHYHGSSKNLTEEPKAARAGSAKESVRIFISYSSEQQAYADSLHHMLENSGYAPVLDSYDITGGQQLTKRIESLVSDADYFVLLLSSESINSKWVQFEIDLAYMAGLIAEERLLPVEVSDVPSNVANSLLHIPKNTYNWLDGKKGARGVLDWIAKREKKLTMAGVPSKRITS